MSLDDLRICLCFPVAVIENKFKIVIEEEDLIFPQGRSSNDDYYHCLRIFDVSINEKMIR